MVIAKCWLHRQRSNKRKRESMKNKILSNVIASRRRERINCGTILSRQRRSNPVSILNSSVMQLISFLILAAKVLLFTCFFISTQHAIAATTAADELAQLLNNTRTMQAKFEQFSINRSGARMGQKTTARYLFSIGSGKSPSIYRKGGGSEISLRSGGKSALVIFFMEYAWCL